MANSYLQRSSANSGASGTTATVSMWVRKHDESAGDGGFFQFWSSGSNFCSGYANPTLKMRNFISNGYSQGDITCNRKLRDNGAWYHLQCVWDTTNSTAGDRMRLYINGVRETSFSSSTNPSSGYSFYPLEAGTFYLNRYNANTTTGSQSYSHVHYCDGYAYEPTVFGEFDTNGTGEWKIKTSPTCNYGSNGFFILKDGNSTTDQSGNNKTFSTTGTLTNTEDNPSNVFATFNPLIANTGANFLNGNCNVHRTSAGNYRRIGCTLGATSGKYYAEFLLGASQWGGVCLTNGGDIARTEAGSNGYMGEYADDKSVGVRQDGIVYSSGANVSSAQWNQGSMSTSDRLCLALDMDNKKLFLGKNGTWSSSSNPATNTGGITLTGDSYTFCVATSNADCIINTGNGNFANGTTANLISSEGTNASGIGKFEYDVPSQGSTIFTALSTKGLNL